MFTREDTLNQMFAVLSVVAATVLIVCVTLLCMNYLCFTNKVHNAGLIGMSLGSAITSVVCYLLSVFFEKGERNER